MTTVTAPGKLILCGEHAVVYGRPAIALPLRSVCAHVTVSAAPPGSGIIFDAQDMGRRWTLADDPAHPLSELVVQVLDYLAIATIPDLLIGITSAIPVASGMGSSAAVATALVRALVQHMGCTLAARDISALVYESERRLHGTPSGIDNTVIAFEQPIWFVRQAAGASHGVPGARQQAQAVIEPLTIGAPFALVIGDTGVRSATRLPVGAVRRRWQAKTARYEALFDAIGLLVAQARDALARGDIAALGPLLDQNHDLLQQLGVSSAKLDRLIVAARGAGALGAKLSGGGWGGVMFALVTPQTQGRVAAALQNAGAAQVLEAAVQQT